ncbi:MAG: hypothetical protein HZA16_15965 [Nitrospirae bacterium]|nr:hypothetical protein [Nitrospirota bacterium]
MDKLNCWEFKKCGREKEGAGLDKSCVCPVARKISADGLNNGRNGGRICWVIADLCCDRKVDCVNTRRGDPCFSCEFRYKVMIEEGLLNVCKSTGELLRLTSLKTE